MQLVKDTLVIYGGKRGPKILGDLGFVRLTGSDIKFEATTRAYFGNLFPSQFLVNPVKVLFPFVSLLLFK